MKRPRSSAPGPARSFAGRPRYPLMPTTTTARTPCAAVIAIGRWGMGFGTGILDRGSDVQEMYPPIRWKSTGRHTRDVAQAPVGVVLRREVAAEVRPPRLLAPQSGVDHEPS